jgi:outer membrane protein assembly factor BamB
MTRRAALVAALVLVLVLPALAAAPRFWRFEGTSVFLKGELESLSVDSEARLRLGPAVGTLFDPETPTAWCVARGHDGVFYVGTGNDGRLFRVEGDQGRVVFDAEELELHAVAVGSDGTVYAATSPEGAVYAIDSDGEARRFFDPSETYIWALAFDGSGNLVVATGAEGRVYRVGPDGTSTTLLSSSDAHVLSLAVDSAGHVYAGSSPGGVVYRIDAEDQVFVLLDSPFSEIKALAVAADGGLYAGAVNGEGATPPPPSLPAAPTPGQADPTAQVTVSEAFAPITPLAPPPVVSAVPSTATPRGAVLRIDPDGTVETLWSSADDVPHAIAPAEDGVLVGTGDSGKVYRVARSGAWALIATLSADQVTGISTHAGEPAVLVTSNPARLHTLSRHTAAEGTFVSEVKDAEAVSTWGRLRWEGRAPAGTSVRLETRSGNTSRPDTTWGPWTEGEVGARGAPIKSESSRFLQVRVTLAGKDGATPEVEALSAAYLQRNLRPRVTSITVHPPGEVFQKPIAVTGEPEVLGLDPDPLGERSSPRAPGAPAVTAFSRKFQRRGLQTIVWKAEDSNGDALVYEVAYRALGDQQWRVLRRGVADPVLAWDTTAMPDGRYLVRVTASDAPDNPPALALAGDKDSASFEVDNSPPTLRASLAPGTRDRIRATAQDSGSRIRRLEFSLDAGRWQEVHPVDGINDSTEETYEFSVQTSTSPGPHVVVLRVSDWLGNVATGRVDVP